MLLHLPGSCSRTLPSLVNSPRCSWGSVLSPETSRLLDTARSLLDPAWGHPGSPPLSANLPRSKPRNVSKSQLSMISICHQACGHGAGCYWPTERPARFKYERAKAQYPWRGECTISTKRTVPLCMGAQRMTRSNMNLDLSPGCTSSDWSELVKGSRWRRADHATHQCQAEDMGVKLCAGSGYRVSLGDPCIELTGW